MDKILTFPDLSGAAPANYAWSACYEGREENGPFGWGRTEDEARRDLIDNYDQPA